MTDTTPPLLSVGLPTRAERVRLARVLRDGGMPRREIADRLGVSPHTVIDYLRDPEGRRRRSFEQGATCPLCARPVTRPGRLCGACRQEGERRWTREAVLVALQRWAERYGEWPRRSHWDREHASRPGEAAALARARLAVDGPWPSPRTVDRLFGSFAAALAAAQHTTLHDDF